MEKCLNGGANWASEGEGGGRRRRGRAPRISSCRIPLSRFGEFIVGPFLDGPWLPAANARYSPAYQASRERGKEWGKDSPVQLPVQERAAVMDGGVPSFCARPWIFARDDFPPFEADLMQESVCRKKERGRRSVGNVKCVH